MSLKPSDILALSKAGYTSQQIAMIASAAEKEAQQGQQKPDPQPEQQEQPKPEQKPDPQPEQPNPDPQPIKQDAFDGIMAELQKLNQNIYQANIRNSNMPEQQSPDDIIAEIIRPTKINQGG